MEASAMENLAPAELKKLRNKQRKAKRKAEQESALAAQVQVKREQHHKARQQQEAGDPEAPQLDELVPDKLARVEDPLEQAIKFLAPLQNLAKDRIETHLMAFEIYYRKEKPLVMVQAVRRALRLSSIEKCPALHDALVRLAHYAAEHKDELHSSVQAVLNNQTEDIFKGRTAEQMNVEFLSGVKTLEAALVCARVKARLTPEAALDALKIATSFDYPDANLENCTAALNAIQEGDFGSCDPQMEDYIARCRERFPYALAFKSPSELVESLDSAGALRGHDAPEPEHHDLGQ